MTNRKDILVVFWPMTILCLCFLYFSCWILNSFAIREMSPNFELLLVIVVGVVHESGLKCLLANYSKLEKFSIRKGESQSSTFVEGSCKIFFSVQTTIPSEFWRKLFCFDPSRLHTQMTRSQIGNIFRMTVLSSRLLHSLQIHSARRENFSPSLLCLVQCFDLNSYLM